MLPFTGTVEEWGVTRWRESLRWFLFLALLKMARSAMFPERPEQSQVCCSWSTCTLEIELPLSQLESRAVQKRLLEW